MSRRLLAMLEKELRQHGLGFVLALALSAVCFAFMTLGAARGARNVTILEAHLHFTRFVVPLVAAVLGHRLIVMEYHGQTQRFLEGLPIHRAEWVSLKLALGLAVVEACALGSLATNVWIAGRSEAITASHVLMIGSRTAVWSACAWAFFSLTGSAGRFRFVIYGLLLVCAVILDESTDLEWARVAPFSLVDQRMVLERSSWPIEALVYGAALTAVMFVVAVGLSLFHDGAVAESLSRRMSQKEKALLAFVIFATFAVASAFDERQTKKPYTLVGKNVLRSKRTALQIEAVDPQRGLSLLEKIEGDLIAFKALLGLRQLTPVFVAQRGDLDGRTTEPVTLTHNDGLLLRANLAASDFDADALRFEIIQRVYARVTEGRSHFEPKAWLVDGVLRDWVERRLDSPSPSLLRGLWATREVGIDAQLLHRWARTNERFGREVAEGIAHTGVEVLTRIRGKAARDKLARAFLSKWAPHDVRALLFEWTHPLQGEFQTAAGISYADFLVRWRTELASLRNEPRFAALATLPRAKVSLRVQAGEGQVRDVHYRVTLDRAPSGAPLLALAHYDVGPFDKTAVSRLELQRDERPWPQGQTTLASVLRGAYGEGDRALLVIELENDQLGVPLRLYATRRAFE